MPNATSATVTCPNRARIAAMAGAIADRLEAEQLAEYRRTKEIYEWVKQARSMQATDTLTGDEPTKAG